MANKTNKQSDKTDGDGSKDAKKSDDNQNAVKKTVEGGGESLLSQVIHISIIIVLSGVLISLWNTYQVN